VKRCQEFQRRTWCLVETDLALRGLEALLDPGVGAVADLQELDRVACGRRVGGEDLVPHPVDVVEQ